MLSAEKLSEAIRMKRKKLQAEGVDRMVDTAALPQMNPQDVWNLEKEVQMKETIPNARSMIETEESPVMTEDQKDDSQDMEVLKKKMARVRAIFDRL